MSAVVRRAGAALRCALFVSSEPQLAVVIVIRRGTEIVQNRQGAPALSGQVRHYPCALVGGLGPSVVDCSRGKTPPFSG